MDQAAQQGRVEDGGKAGVGPCDASSDRRGKGGEGGRAEVARPGGGGGTGLRDRGEARAVWSAERALEVVADGREGGVGGKWRGGRVGADGAEAGAVGGGRA